MSQEVSIWEVAARRRTNFDSPEQLWLKFIEYCKWCDSHPLYIEEQKKSPGKGQILTDSQGVQTYIPPEDTVTLARKRPYTKTGFCVFAGVASNYLRLMRLEDRDAGGLKDNEPWMAVLDMMDNVIFTNQYEGAAAGQFNPQIVQRGLGLVDKVEEKKEIVEVKQVFRIGDAEFTLE